MAIRNMYTEIDYRRTFAIGVIPPTCDNDGDRRCAASIDSISGSIGVELAEDKIASKRGRSI